MKRERECCFKLWLDKIGLLRWRGEGISFGYFSSSLSLRIVPEQCVIDLPCVAELGVGDWSGPEWLCRYLRSSLRWHWELGCALKSHRVRGDHVPAWVCTSSQLLQHSWREAELGCALLRAAVLELCLGATLAGLLCCRLHHGLNWVLQVRGPDIREHGWMWQQNLAVGFFTSSAAMCPEGSEEADGRGGRWGGDWGGGGIILWF